MSYFIIGVGLLIGGLLLVNWAASAKPGEVLKALKWIGLGLGALVLLFLVVSGRLAFLWGLAAAALPWIGRLRLARRLWKAARGPRGGDSSSVSTRYFEMTLDHDTGAMDGRIKEGRFAGQWLSELSEGDRIDLAREVARADAQSMRLLEAYLDRMHGPEWRDAFGGEDGGRDGRYEGGFGGDGGAGGGGGSGSDSGPMSPEEAYKVLGLDPGAGKDDIKRAHRRLMKVAHPDVGGSDYMASKINEAKRVLLGD